MHLTIFQKLIFLTLFLTCYTQVSAQDVKRSSAYTHFKNGELDKAKTIIDEVSQNEETINHPKTWYFKALIYNGIARKDQNSFASDQLSDEALKSIIKAKNLDKDGTYKTEIKSILLNISMLFFNNGVLRYNKGMQEDNKESYKYALLDFDNFFKTFELLGDDTKEINEAMSKNGINENHIRFYAGFSATMIKNYESAKKYFHAIYLTGKGEPQAYTNYCTILLEEGNKEMALTVVEKAKEIWPADEDIEIMKLQVYQQTGKTGVLTDDIEKALLSDPHNVVLLSSLAEAYDKISFEYKTQKNQEDYKLFREKAEANYLKAIAINPEDLNIKYNLHYNLGVLYFNPAVDSYNLWVKDKNEKRVNFYNEFFNKSIEQLEKALHIRPDNTELIDMMMRVYLILEDEDNALKMKEKLNNLKK